MNKKTVIIIGGAVLILGLCACMAVAGFIFYQAGQKADAPVVVEDIATEISATLDVPAEDITEATQAPGKDDESTTPGEAVKTRSKEVANTFIGYLADREYEDALTMTTQEMRDNGGSAEMFRGIVEDKAMDPEEWVWMTVKQQGDYISLDGVIHLVDKRRALIKMEVATSGDELLVSYLDIKVDGTSDPGQYTTWSKDREREENTFAIVAAGKFLNGWADQDVDSAWSYTSNSLRESLGGDKQKLLDYWADFKITPDYWTWEDQIQKTSVGNAHPTMLFTASVSPKEGGDNQTLEIVVDWEDGYWNVSTVNLIQP